MRVSIGSFLVEIDLQRDLSRIWRGELIAVGYDEHEVMAINDGVDLFRCYSKALRRFISRTPRNVHKASTFPNVERHLDAVRTIEELFQKGGDVVPYLSKRIMRLEYSDMILDDWGIYHLHLGDSVSIHGPNKGFIKRTCLLLYCGVTESDVYFVNVLPHNNWTTQKLVQTIHDEWPDILSDYRGPGPRQVRPMSDAQITALRTEHHNYEIVMNDGTAYFLIGGGFLSDGTSMFDTDSALIYERWTADTQDGVLRWLSTIVEQAPNGPVCNNIRLELRVDQFDNWSVVDLDGRFVLHIAAPVRYRSPWTRR